jgi:hypothetical protein
MANEYDKRECEEFLKRLEDWEDSTWGFYVYGNYARPSDGNDDETKSHAQEAAGEACPHELSEKALTNAFIVDDARFQAILNKVHAHVADELRYNEPAPYNQQFIDTLRLQPAAYLPGASITEVCEHFRENYAVLDHNDPLHEEKNGHKYDWCLVIDDKALQSIESVPDPIRPTPPDGADPRQLSWQASHMILLNKHHTLMEEPEILAMASRSAKGPRNEWSGWLTFSLTDFKRVYEELYQANDIKTWIKHEDKPLHFF